MLFKKCEKLIIIKQLLNKKELSVIVFLRVLFVKNLNKLFSVGDNSARGQTSALFAIMFINLSLSSVKVDKTV